MDVGSRRFFPSIKREIVEPVLQYSNFSKPFILTTDASEIAIGGILLQGSITKNQPICFANFNKTENKIKYNIYEKEALAIIYCVKHFLFILIENLL